MRLKSRARTARQPDVIPLINIVFLMLIFFLVSATLRPFSLADVRPPFAEGDAGVEGGTPRIYITDDARILINGSEVGREGLKASLTEARLAQTQTTTTLTVVADRGLDARQLVRTIADAQAAGFQDVRVITERGQAK